MLIKRRFGWEIPEHKVTPEAVFLNRRAVLSGLAGAAMTGLAGPALAEGDPSRGLYPAPLNPAYKDAGRAVTDEKYNTNYNNFYEFGTSKGIAAEAENLKIRPWEIAIDASIPPSSVFVAIFRNSFPAAMTVAMPSSFRK